MISVLPVQLPLFSFEKSCIKCSLVQPLSAFPTGKNYCRACDRARATAYRNAHREEALERGRIWRETHRESARAEAKAYRIAHPELVRRVNAEWRATHVEEIKQQTRAWQLANPEAVRALTQRRRARKRGAAGTFCTSDVLRMKETQQGLCAYCQKPYGRFHIEHKQPLCRGGSNDPINLCLSCARCNHRKGFKTESEFRELIHQYP